jgi:hypothetical protein
MSLYRQLARSAIHSAPYPSAITSLLDAGIHSMDTVATRRSVALRLGLLDEFSSRQVAEAA